MAKGAPRVAAATVLLAAAFCAAGPEARSPRRMLLGCYPSWIGDELPPAALDLKLFTHIGHCFLLFDRDGNARPEGTVPSRALTRLAHRAGVKVILGLGGADSGPVFAAVTADPKALDRLVRATATIVRDFGYDGVEIDWEFPGNRTERDRLTALARRLREALDRLDGRPSLSVSLPASGYAGRWFDAARLNRFASFYELMAFDNAGPWRGSAAHNAPLRRSARDPEGGSAEAALEYWTRDRGLSAGRINLGLPLYGRACRVSEPHASVRDPASAWSEMEYREIAKLPARGWTRRFDADAGVPWLLAPDRSAVVGYDDEESVAVKARWARQKGCRGVFFWQILGDRMPNGSHPLIRAAASAWPGV